MSASAAQARHLSTRDFHDAGFADPRSSHRAKQSPGCGCLWCSPGPCNLCGLLHTNPSVTDGCLNHAIRTHASADQEASR